MATVDKSIRLTFKELKNLSRKYNTDNEADSKERETDGRPKRSRRPEREIYQPGRTKLSKRKPDDLASPPRSTPDMVENPPRHHSCHEDVHPGTTSVDHSFLPSREMATTRTKVTDNDPSCMTEQLANLNLNATKPTLVDKPKKKHKRPDVRIYVPKPKQHVEESVEQKNQNEKELGLVDLHQTCRVPRDVNVKSCDNNMVTTVVSQHDNLVCGERKQPFEVAGETTQGCLEHTEKALLTEKHSRQLTCKKHSDNSKFKAIDHLDLTSSNNPSDQSFESLDWDYQVEMELAKKKYEGQNIDNEEDTVCHPAHIEDEYENDLTVVCHFDNVSHNNHDKKRRRRRKGKTKIDECIRLVSVHEKDTGQVSDVDNITKQDSSHIHAKKQQDSAHGHCKKKHNVKGRLSSDFEQDTDVDQLQSFSGMIVTNSRYEREESSDHILDYQIVEHEDLKQLKKTTKTDASGLRNIPRPDKKKHNLLAEMIMKDSDPNDHKKHKMKGARTGPKQLSCEDNDYTSHEDHVWKDKKTQLKVTFAQNERQVCCKSNRDSEVFTRPPKSTEEDASHRKPKIGGLIHLPAGQLNSDSPDHNPHVRSRGHRGRGGSQRYLYDPNNPSKPVHPPSPQQLQFYDPSDPSSPLDPSVTGGLEFLYDYHVTHDVAGAEYSPSPHMDTFYMGFHPLHYYEKTAMMDDQYQTDICSNSDFEVDTAKSVSKSAAKVKAEGLIQEIASMESQLTNIISRTPQNVDVLRKILTLRKDVQIRCEQVILLDLDVTNKHNIEQLMWKSAFYQVIEMFRKLLATPPHNLSTEALKQQLLNLLEEGAAFYESLLGNLQTNYRFELEDFLDSNKLPSENQSRTVKLGLLCAQRTTICLGDIGRYKEQTTQTSNYGKARNWYLKAQQIAPKNGRPYNQLAILALYTRRKLDAVYYYMRSLAASNPFITARESLMSLFDEARKKAEMSEKRKQQEKCRAKHHRSVASKEGHRVEIWISTDGSTSKDHIDDDDESTNINNLSAIELNKKFLLSFLHVHGKLFTKIGMENFTEVSSQMFLEFEALIQHCPIPVGNTRILQLVAINMFAIENSIPKGITMENCRSLLQEQAVQLGLDMFGLLVRRCTRLLCEHLDSQSCQILDDDLHQLFPSIKVWTDWMMCHPNLWNPPPQLRHPELGPSIDTWSELAHMCNTLVEVDITHVKLYAEKKEGCDPIILDEDNLMAGFVPLLSLPQILMYVHTTVDKEIAKDCLRVDKVRTFADYLCGIEPPLLIYNVETRLYESIAPETQETGESLHTSTLDNSFQDEADDEQMEGESKEDVHIIGEEDYIRNLKAKKVDLERQVARQERQRESMQALVENERQKRPMQLEIRPSILIPDTNCFIDHLHDIKTLLATNQYNIVIPLVVINELDGLALGSRDRQYDKYEHAEMVHRQASSTLKFLEEQFEAGNPHVKAMTSKGTLLDSLAFRSEETTLTGNNDDLILLCCLHYCKDRARDFMPRNKDEPIRLIRDVVLLTDDRNLRLKAHTRNVPVKDVKAFLKWARIG